MKIFIGVFLGLFLLNASALITGANKPFVAGDKLVFKEDFSKCPAGEIPMSFDKLNGAVECVKYNNQIWVAPSSDADVRLYKKVNLGDDEFAIEFDFVSFVKKSPGADFLVRLLVSKDDKNWDKKRAPYDLQIHEDYKAYAFWFEGAGKIGRFKNMVNKKIHVAISVRRHQIRVYAKGKRLTVLPFKLGENEFISGVEFSFYDDTNKYEGLLGNITISKYSKAEAKPKPESVGVTIQKDKNSEKLTISEKILFDFNKFILKDEAKKALNVVGEYIKLKNPKKIVVTGYTDNIGSDEYNLRLSLQRAQSVADYLMYCKGIDAKRMAIKGLGKANPIASNDTKEGQAKNRRVEIKLIGE